MMTNLSRLAGLLVATAVVFTAGFAAQNNTSKGAPRGAPAAAAAAATKQTSENYRLLVRDQIEVRVFGEEDLTVVQRIDGQGNVRLNLIENVPVAGKTVREAEEHVAKLYVEKKFLRNPMVTVRVTEYSTREVIVLGQVMTPGPVAFPIEVDQMDIVEVIGKCGGFTELAKTKEVRLTTTDASGREDERGINVDAMYRGGGNVEKVWVRPGDKIYVPRVAF